ncbi:ABC transporter permease [Micromonospora zamorensis]|uniref:ABC transporter permease n=1 Tax=Micromonospora zamorensis TaxID=709883 RepID=UPI003676B595
MNRQGVGTSSTTLLPLPGRDSHDQVSCSRTRPSGSTDTFETQCPEDSYLFGGALQVPGGGSYREFLMPGMYVMTMVFGISLTTIAVAEDLERGVTDRLRSMPVSPLAPLVARAVADMLFALVTLAVLLLTGLAIGWRAHGGVGATLAAVGLILLLRFALIWVGIFLGLVTRGQTAVVAVQTLEFPLGFLSNAFVAPSTMPAWLGAVAAWNPLSATVGATRELFGNPGWGGDSWPADPLDERAPGGRSTEGAVRQPAGRSTRPGPAALSVAAWLRCVPVTQTSSPMNASRHT